MNLVSVIMNCYNGEKYLRESLDSLIKQTYNNWELIFWDNVSSDNSKKILLSYIDSRINYFQSDKHGTLGDGRSQAILKAKGDFIAFLDSDDIWYPNRLSECISEFNKSKEICLVYSNTIFFSKKNKRILYSSIQPSGDITEKLLVNYNLSLESVTIRKKFLDKLQIKFDNKFSHIADFDLFVRISTKGKSNYLNKVLCGWRMHSENDSFKRPYLFIKERRDWIKKYKEDDMFLAFNHEIEELRLICDAEEKLDDNNLFAINNIFQLRNYKFINKKNRLKFILSCLPIIKLIYKLKRLAIRI